MKTLCKELFTRGSMDNVLDGLVNTDSETVMIILYTGPGNSGHWKSTNALVAFTCTELKANKAEIVLAGVNEPRCGLGTLIAQKTHAYLNARQVGHIFVNSGKDDAARSFWSELDYRQV